MALLIALTVAYFVVISAGGESEARFRVPVIPHLAIAAAMGVEAIRRSVVADASHVDAGQRVLVRPKPAWRAMFEGGRARCQTILN